MNIPKTLKVGGLNYKVRMADDIDLDHSGETDNKNLLIKLLKTAKPDAVEATFIHEILHAINIELAEKDVEFLAMALYGVIKDNPGLFKNGK